MLMDCPCFLTEKVPDTRPARLILLITGIISPNGSKTATLNSGVMGVKGRFIYREAVLFDRESLPFVSIISSIPRLSLLTDILFLLRSADMYPFACKLFEARSR